MLYNYLLQYTLSTNKKYKNKKNILVNPKYQFFDRITTKKNSVSQSLD